MVLAIIFLVLFAVSAGISIYRTINLVKSPMIETDFAGFIKKNVLFVTAATVCFVVAAFGIALWTKAELDFLHGFELAVGSLFFSAGFFTAVNCFVLHYYGRNIPEGLDKWLFRIIIIGFCVALVFFFVFTNGLAPYLTYPLVNGLSFSHGFVTPKSGYSPNIAFYALCILSGAILVYFICDHYMYKKYGRHGTLESTFIVAFPAGILGARIWYVIGNWNQEFAGEPFWRVFAIWEGGLTILGGAIMGIVVGVAWFLWRNKKLSIWYAFDLALPAILVAQAIGRWGNFFNCEVHGLEVPAEYFKWLPEIIWRNAQYSSTSGFAADGNLYVPLFFIECITNLLGFFVLAHIFGKALRKFIEPGDLGFGYIIWYGLTRVLMEPLRATDFQMGQDGYWSWVWSMIFVFVGTLLIVVNHIIRSLLKKKNNTYIVKRHAKVFGLISSGVILVISAALIAVGAILMISNAFNAVVAYNSFNVGLIVLVLGCSVLLTLGISLPIFFNSLNKQKGIANASL